VRKKYRPERKGCRDPDTAVHYNTVEMIVTEETRTRQPTGGPRYLLLFVVAV